MKKIIRATPKKMSISAPIKSLYDADFYKWTKTQATLLKKKDMEHIDLKNIIEEIKSLGNSDKRALRSQTIRLLMHMLKKKYQPERDISNSWDSSIFDALREIKYIIEDSPSLKNELKKLYLEDYSYARKKASIETGLDINKFPEECPWSFDEIFKDILKKKY